MEQLPKNVPEEHLVLPKPGEVIVPMTVAGGAPAVAGAGDVPVPLDGSEGDLSLIHISEPTRRS